MQNFRGSLCSLVSVALLATPLSQAHAQSQASVHAACVTYSALPAGAGIAVKLPSDQEWRSVQHSSQRVILRSADGGTAEVRIWKQMPRGEADLTASNMRDYTIDMTPTSNPNSCAGGAANYRVQSGADGYTLAGQREPVKHEGSSAAAVVVGALVFLGLLDALFGGGSPSSNDTSSRDERERALDREQQARRDQEAEARAEAKRAADRRSAAEAWERLQRPNSLGW